MTNPSKRLQHRILHFKYCRATEYDLDGDRLDTDEFIYDSDVSVEDKVQPSPLAMSLRKQYIKYDNKGQVTRDKEPAQRGGSVDSTAAKDLPSRPPPRLSALKQPIVNMSDNSSGAPSDTNVGIVPDPSVTDRKIEEISEHPIFLDGSPVAQSRYEAIFESTKKQ